MNVIRHKDANYKDRLRQLTEATSLFDRVIEERTHSILEAVLERGDGALLEFTERFDGVKLRVEQLAVTQSEMVRASLLAGPELRGAVALASGNIEQFARQSLRKSWSGQNSQGGKVGEKFDPFQRVGIYIPAGTAPLVSTALMTVTLARTAGCPEIVVCTPPGKDGEINSALLFAMRTAGATEIYRVGGAQAIGALGYGTPAIPRVQKIFGPGNAYVVAAKRLLFGRVSVDLLPGPSEVLILADETADAKFIAADLLAQAEHGSGHERVWLLTPSGKLLRTVEKQIAEQLRKLSRIDFVHHALEKNGWLVQVKDLEQGIEIANRIAPEHCEIMTAQPGQLGRRIVTAGALFLGPYTPTVLGDYVAGPSHVLPTGGAGVSFAGLTVDQFQRRTSVVEYNRAALRNSLAAVEQFAAMEGLDAHGRSARIRLENSKRKR
jgi:histidinol dehydrogenase